jgi:hypothetical protein
MVFILAFIFIFNQNIGLVVTLIFMHSIAYSFSIGQLLLFYAAKMLDSTGYVVMANWFATFLVAISAENTWNRQNVFSILCIAYYLSSYFVKNFTY